MKFAALRSLIINHLSFLILFLFSAFYFLSSATSAHAAAPTITPTQTKSAAVAANTNPDVPNNLHNWTQSVMIEVMSALTCQIAGVDPVNPKQSCLGADQKTGKIGFLPSPQEGGAIGFMGNMIATLYTPPLHTADYFQNLAQNFGISKKTYAQTTGTGFQSLTPLINIWAAFRNIVYLLLVIVFVVIGLAIMLRVKIDPRTVMTIQNQIPKIIIGILAVTFSFAIAGFLIDMMWVVIYLIYNTITQAAGGSEIINMANFHGTPFGALGAGNGWGILWEVSKKTGETIMNFLGFDSVLNIFRDGLTGKNWIQGALLLMSPAGPLLGALTILQGILGLIGGIITFLIISIALLVALFRLWFTLIKAYVMILLDVVLAPFWIIGGIVPGSPINLSGWLKDIGANLLAFPVVIAMFMLAVVFKNIFVSSAATNPLFFPPLIGNSSDFDPTLIGSLISLGIILMTPNVVNMLKAAIKTPKTDTGISAIIGAGTGTASAPFKSVMTGVSFVAGHKVAGRILPTFLGGSGKEAVSGAKTTQDRGNVPHVQGS